MAYPTPTRFLPFPPNWLDAFRETFSFRSTVIQSGNGNEQTNSVWGNYPRRTLDYGVMLERLQAQRLDALLMSWSGRFFEVAHWGEGRKLATAASIGQSTIYGDFSLASFIDGGRAVIWKDSENYELVTISSSALGGFDPGMILSAPLEKNWPAGSRVFPVFPGIIEGDTAKQRISDRLTRANIRVLCDPANMGRATASSPAAVLYRGVELFLDKTNWKSGMRVQSKPDRKVLDKGTPTFEVRSVSHYHSDAMSYSAVMATTVEIASFRRFIGRREGRARPVYMPTGVDDLILVANPTSGLNWIDVEKSLYGELQAAHPARRDLILLLRDGSYITRRITYVDALTTTTDRINLDDVFGATIPMSSVKRVSFLGLYRLSDDDVSLEWRTNSVAEATLDFTLKTNP